MIARAWRGLSHTARIVSPSSRGSVVSKAVRFPPRSRCVARRRPNARLTTPFLSVRRRLPPRPSSRALARCQSGVCVGGSGAAVAVVIAERLRRGGARGAADAMAARHWRLMGSRTQTEARGVFMQHVRRRWSAAFWRSWRALMHARMPCIGAATSDVLRSRAPAPDEEPIAWAEGRGAAFPQEHAGVDRGGAARDRA